jgi:hypothetical protein
MRIAFERSGGFAGLTLRADVNTASLPREDAERLQALLSRVDFFELPEDLDDDDGAQADRFRYVVKVSDGDRHRTVQVGDGYASDAIQDLLKELTRLAKARRTGAAG